MGADGPKTVSTLNGAWPSLAYPARGAASYDYMQVFHQYVMGSAMQIFMNIGAYISFYGADPSWYPKANGMGLPASWNLYNTSSGAVSTEEKKFFYPGYNVASSASATFAVVPAFAANSANQNAAVDDYNNSSASVPIQPAIAQTMFGGGVDWSGSTGGMNRSAWEESNTLRVPNVESLASHYAPTSTSSSFTNSSLGTASVPGDGTTVNDVNIIQSFDSAHFQSGYGSTNNEASAVPNRFPALTGPASGIEAVTSLYWHRGYKHLQNVIWRRMFGIRGVIKLSIAPGSEASFSVPAGKRIISSRTGNYGMYNCSRVLPNNARFAADSSQPGLGDYPSYFRSLTEVMGGPSAAANYKCDLKGSTFMLMSVVGQKALDTDRTGNATMCADLTMKCTYDVKYRYCVRRRHPYDVKPPATSRRQYLFHDDATVDRATQATNYRIPAPSSRWFLNANSNFTGASIVPGRVTV